jgi:uncharacterized protein (DUF1697 family)
MDRQVVLLRAVNVGGRKLPMASLRSGLEAAGCTDVVTYIQSGNVVTPPAAMPTDLESWLEGVISKISGFAVPVVVRSLVDLEQAVERNPFPDAAGTQCHVVFFAETPADDLLGNVDLASFAPEACELIGRDLYLYLPNGMGQTKLAIALERSGRKSQSPTIGTARNWNTVLKMLELARQPTDE